MFDGLCILTEQMENNERISITINVIYLSYIVLYALYEIEPAIHIRKRIVKRETCIESKHLLGKSGFCRRTKLATGDSYNEDRVELRWEWKKTPYSH